jgi:hypothetical protein
MGDWLMLRRILELVIREEDTAYWLFIDRYWSAFKNASSDLVAVEVKGSKAV